MNKREDFEKDLKSIVEKLSAMTEDLRKISIRRFWNTTGYCCLTFEPPSIRVKIP